MAQFRISGVWKNSTGNVVAYAFHELKPGGITRSQRVPKALAINLLETQGHSATTWLWSYARSGWDIGSKVEVVSEEGEKFLRTDSANSKTKHLAHLIDYDWCVLG